MPAIRPVRMKDRSLLSYQQRFYFTKIHEQFTKIRVHPNPASACGHQTPDNTVSSDPNHNGPLSTPSDNAYASPPAIPSMPVSEPQCEYPLESCRRRPVRRYSIRQWSGYYGSCSGRPFLPRVVLVQSSRRSE